MATQYYYLVASLPMVNFGDPPPMSSEEFLDLVESHAGPETRRRLAGLTLAPGTEPYFKSERNWTALETYIRNFLLTERADRLDVDAAQWLRPEWDVFPGLEPQLDEALATEDPLQREKILDEIRWSSLDGWGVSEEFSVEALVLYRYKLLIAEKWGAVSGDEGLEVLDKVVLETVEQAWEKRHIIDS